MLPVPFSLPASKPTEPQFSRALLAASGVTDAIAATTTLATASRANRGFPGPMAVAGFLPRLFQSTGISPTLALVSEPESYAADRRGARYLRTDG